VQACSVHSAYCPDPSNPIHHHILFASFSLGFRVSYLRRGRLGRFVELDDFRGE
jgi:hypothetical protein